MLSRSLNSALSGGAWNVALTMANKISLCRILTEDEQGRFKCLLFLRRILAVSRRWPAQAQWTTRPSEAWQSVAVPFQQWLALRASWSVYNFRASAGYARQTVERWPLPFLWLYTDCKHICLIILQSRSLWDKALRTKGILWFNDSHFISSIDFWAGRKHGTSWNQLHKEKSSLPSPTGRRNPKKQHILEVKKSQLRTPHRAGVCWCPVPAVVGERSTHPPCSQGTAVCKLLVTARHSASGHLFVLSTPVMYKKHT